MDLNAFCANLDQHGWAITPRLLGDADLAAIASDLAPLVAGHVGRGGVRNLLSVSGRIQELARSTTLRALAESVLGSACGAARVIYFDKSADANWRVVWHQDLTIAVRERVPTPAFGPWSEKEGVVHVQAPADILERMVAIRVHLDDSGAENGPVRVLPGSHRAGRLTVAEVDEWKARVAPHECLVERGAVLAFRPLVVHASSPAQTPRHRRVIHFEYAAGALPGGLVWHTWIGEGP